MPSIINSDDGVVSGTSGLKSTGGNDGLLNIQTNGSNAISISAGQRSTFPTTIGVGGATPSTSGSGISFPATQSASSDANTLDDYEEGTWTPSVGGSTGNPTLTYATRVGYYTKVGRVVTIHCGIQPSSTSVSGSGDLRITGLPFTSANLSDCTATGVSYTNGNLNWGTSKTSLVFAVSSNTSNITVWGMQNATTEAAVPVTNFTTSSQYLLFSITYITST